MNLFDWAHKLSRRVFLAGGAATVAAIAAKPLLAGPALAKAAADASGLDTAQTRTLLKFTRDLFPHDRLDDSAYQKAIAPLLAEAASEPSTKKLLADGIAQLNASTTASSGKNYIDVSDENIRVAAIKKIESSAFFAKVYGDTITPLYNQPEIWAKFG